MRFSKIFMVLAVLLAGFSASAQDIHYSQFYNAPLLLNPALTGKINGTFRVGVNYRNQWFGPVNGRTTFSTPALSFDMPIRLQNGDAFGVGAYIVNDRSSGGMLSRIQFMVTGAFHKGFGTKNNHSLSLGIQAGYIQRRLDINKIKFASQQGDGIFFDENISSGENIDGTTSNVDVNAGFLWTSKFSDNFVAYAGLGVFNLIQPFNTFTDGTDDLMRRISVNGGMDIRVAPKFSLLPSVIYQNQAKAMETNVGLSGAIDFSENFILYTGAYYRVQDAIIPYVGADFKGFRVGVSYDINASSLNDIDTGANGSVELSLIYMGKYIPLPNVNPALYCPRF